jgi:S1-C subfamily serine protease
MKLLENEEPVGSGVTVNSVDPEGVASIGGLKAGDRLYSINDTIVWTASHTEIIELLRSDSELDVKVCPTCPVLCTVISILPIGGSSYAP